MSERRAFLVVIGIALLVSAGLVHLDRWDKAQQLKVETRNLLKNRAIWFASDISNYNFSIVHFSAGGAPPPMRVVVTNGVVQSANLSCPFPHTQDFCRKWEASRKDIFDPEQLLQRAKTIPQLFDQVYMIRKVAMKGALELSLNSIQHSDFRRGSVSTIPKAKMKNGVSKSPSSRSFNDA